jgi:hypothetical protein
LINLYYYTINVMADGREQSIQPIPWPGPEKLMLQAEKMVKSG